MRKIQVNVKIYQDLGESGWMMLAGHWNSNRNYSVYALDYAPNTNGFTASLASLADVIHNPNGEGLSHINI